jgi:hypothetical protein
VNLGGHVQECLTSFEAMRHLQNPSEGKALSTLRHNWTGNDTLTKWPFTPNPNQVYKEIQTGNLLKKVVRGALFPISSAAATANAGQPGKLPFQKRIIIVGVIDSFVMQRLRSLYNMCVSEWSCFDMRILQIGTGAIGS